MMIVIMMMLLESNLKGLPYTIHKFSALYH